MTRSLSSEADLRNTPDALFGLEGKRNSMYRTYDEWLA
jgi:hypothetical protein